MPLTGRYGRPNSRNWEAKIRMRRSANQKVGIAYAATDSSVTPLSNQEPRLVAEYTPSGIDTASETTSENPVKITVFGRTPRIRSLTGVALLSEMPRSPRARLLTH